MKNAYSLWYFTLSVYLWRCSLGPYHNTWTEKPKKSDQAKVPESDTHWPKGTLDLSHMLKRHMIC